MGNGPWGPLRGSVVISFVLNLGSGSMVRCPWFGVHGHAIKGEGKALHKNISAKMAVYLV